LACREGGKFREKRRYNGVRKGGKREEGSSAKSGRSFSHFPPSLCLPVSHIWEGGGEKHAKDRLSLGRGKGNKERGSEKQEDRRRQCPFHSPPSTSAGVKGKTQNKIALGGRGGGRKESRKIGSLVMSPSLPCLAINTRNGLKGY